MEVDITLGNGSIRQIAFVGPFGVGKTTAVHSISRAPVAESEAWSATALATGRTVKATTTVGLEFGDWTSPDGRRIEIVGTPGQARFDLVRRASFSRSSGVVLWLFGNDSRATTDLAEWVRQLRTDGVGPDRLVIALTRVAPDSEALTQTRMWLEEHGAGDVPVLAADPRVAADVDRVLLTTMNRTIRPLGVHE